MNVLLILFYEFFKIGLFAVGGGLATLPFLTSLATKYPEWMTFQDISNMIAVSESTPGPMGINMATYIGNKVGLATFGSTLGGVLGGLVATLGEIAPSIIVILVVARILLKFKENRYVKFAFYGLRAVVIALIAYAGYQVYTVALYSSTAGTLKFVECFMFLVLFTLMLKFKGVHPIIWIFLSAVLGIILGLPSV